MRFARPFLVSSALVGAFAIVAQIQSQNSAVAQFSTVPYAGQGGVNPIDRLPLPPTGTGKPPLVSRTSPPFVGPTYLPVPTPRPTPTPVPVLQPRFPGLRVIRVGLSTAGGAIAVYIPGGATLFDLTQPGLTLTLPPGQRFQFDYGPVRTSKRGDKVFRGPISVSTTAGLSDGWNRVYIAVEGDQARVTTNNNNPRYGRPYRGDLEVFPQKLAEPVKRKGPLALVNVVPLEAYLKGVVPWEMSPSAPVEALKAQAICARTKTLQFVESKKFAPGNFDICDYDACQGYPGTENEKPSTSRAVDETRGLAIFQGGRPIDAVYSTNSGGITASARDVWKATTPVSYLQSVPDFPASSPIAKLWKDGMTEADWAQFCAQDWPSYARPDGVASTRYEARKYRWNQFISVDEASRAFIPEGFAAVTDLEVAQRTPSGRIRQLRVVGISQAAANAAKAVPTPFKTLLPPTLGGAPATPTATAPPPADFSVILEGDAKVRAMFSKRLGSTTALPSSLFTISPQTDADGQLKGWLLQGAGWGHGVGMCQRGAQNHAQEGWDARRILNWYYRGVTIQKVG